MCSNQRFSASGKGANCFALTNRGEQCRPIQHFYDCMNAAEAKNWVWNLNVDSRYKPATAVPMIFGQRFWSPSKQDPSMTQDCKLVRSTPKNRLYWAQSCPLTQAGLSPKEAHMSCSADREKYNKCDDTCLCDCGMKSCDAGQELVTGDIFTCRECDKGTYSNNGIKCKTQKTTLNCKVDTNPTPLRILLPLSTSA